MRNQQNCDIVLSETFNPFIAFLLESNIANCQRLINNKNFWINSNLYRECKADHHAAGIGLDRLIDKFADVGKIYDLLKFIIRFFFRQSQDRRIHIDVFAPGKFWVESRTQFQQRGDAAMNSNLARCRLERTGDNLQQGGFSRSIPADYSDALTTVDFEIDIPQGPEFPIVFFAEGAKQHLLKAMARLIIHLKAF